MSWTASKRAARPSRLSPTRPIRARGAVMVAILAGTTGLAACGPSEEEIEQRVEQDVQEELEERRDVEQKHREGMDALDERREEAE